jgi:hypothetical protein
MEQSPMSQRMSWGLAEISESTGLSVAFLRNEVRLTSIVAVILLGTQKLTLNEHSVYGRYR